MAEKIGSEKIRRKTFTEEMFSHLSETIVCVLNQDAKEKAKESVCMMFFVANQTCQFCVSVNTRALRKREASRSDHRKAHYYLSN